MQIQSARQTRAVDDYPLLRCISSEKAFTEQGHMHNPAFEGLPVSPPFHYIFPPAKLEQELLPG